MTRIAVVIACHDDGELAAEAVASIDEEEPVEVVVVDDGSTDRATRTALDRLAAGGAQVVRREQGGPGPARTTGLHATRARYVLPLDADDALLPGALAAMADVLDGNPDAAFTWGDYEVFGELRGRYRSPSRFLPWTLLYVNVYPVTSLIRREPLERVGGWDEPPGYEDWDLWLAFAEQGLAGAPTPRVVYRRRLHGGSRMLPRARRDHATKYAELRRRHAGLFARRAELRALERPAPWKRVAYPLLFGRRAVVPLRLEHALQRQMLRRGLRLSR